MWYGYPRGRHWIRSPLTDMKTSLADYFFDAEPKDVREDMESLLFGLLDLAGPADRVTLN